MLNPREVAEILGIHPKTVHLWLRTGKLEGIKISSRSWRIPQESLNDFIEKNKNINQKKEVKTPISSDKKSTKIERSSSSHTTMKDYIREIMGEH